MTFPAWLAGEPAPFTAADLGVTVLAATIIVLAVYLPWKLRQ